MKPKTPTQRVAELRQRRAEQGLTRLDVYAHPDDHAAIKILAEKLTKRRLTKAKTNRT
jgi:hypothetical protein